MRLYSDSSVGLPAIAAVALVAVLTGICNAATVAVTVNTDSGSSGELRAAMSASGPGDTIVFNCGTPCEILLKAPLPPITQNLKIDGGKFNQTIIDGAGLYRVFFVDSGTVTIQNLTIQNALAQGGNGGVGGGGGGLGAGAGLFINQSSAVVTIQNVLFIANVAIGGAGGVGDALGTPNGGGGGLVFAGGDGGGGGGGGILSAGGISHFSIIAGIVGGAGGAGGGGGGGGNCTGLNSGGGAGIPFTTNPAGLPGQTGTTVGGGNGGDGGFGGGGGGSGPDCVGAAGGKGGFGGGGGAGSFLPGIGGDGGPGGGGGGTEDSSPSSAGNGGILTPAVHGGAAGSRFGGGGGGAAAGPAIFVNQGSLITINSGAVDANAVPGSGGIGVIFAVPGNPGTADATAVFNFHGMVNGSVVSGPVFTALLNTPPTPLPANIPTLSAGGVMIFAILLAWGAAMRMRETKAGGWECYHNERNL